MWLFESDGDVLRDQRLWLRPGKLYLFGRTASEPGQIAISHKTISRKHLTIKVDEVRVGDGQNLAKRSRLTIEDLKTKSGTVINGDRIKEPHEITGDGAVIKMGHCSEMFRITWHPVVLSFSFTSRELQSDPIAKLSYLEPLDIKFLTEYTAQTTHVVAKKRNTAKGLQALIDGRYLVTDSFVDALAVAATVAEDSDDAGTCALESDYDGYWPNPLDHVPPRGGEPKERPTEAYAPDTGRQEVFEGYTFIFYDKTQFENLMPPITGGKGKALYREVVPEATEVDDFIRYVKSEAGEKGLGSFEDGSEGRGVVVVRFVPSKGDQIGWYTQFFNEVSLRLDHRPIEQNEFLEAVLGKDASILRRPLQLETPNPELRSEWSRQGTTVSSSMDVDQPAGSASSVLASPPPLARRGRARGPARRRFAGFDDGDDFEPAAPQIAESNASDSQEGLFVTQQQPAEEDAASISRTRTSQRKRPASPDHHALMDDIAPTAAAAKRRRIEAGEDPVPREEASEPSESQRLAAEKAATKAQKARREIDVLNVARQQREALEARARAEKEDLAHLPDDVDLGEIRRLQIVEDMAVREPLRRAGAGGGEGEGEGAEDPRWDARWNGRKNFKRFRQRGAAAGRPVARVIVALDEVKSKEYGLGDDYWLEDDDRSRRRARGGTQGSSFPEERRQPSPPRALPARIVLSESEDEPSEIARPSQARVARGSQAKTTQSQSAGRSQAKRPAAAPAREPPAKKPKTTRRVAVPDSDDSDDDELGFKFGKRR